MSFKMIISFLCSYPILFRASKAIPPVNAPSPITETIFSDVFLKSLLTANARAADKDVELCPVSQTSKLLSLLLGNPESPLNFLRELKNFALPVRIL